MLEFDQLNQSCDQFWQCQAVLQNKSLTDNSIAIFPLFYFFLVLACHQKGLAGYNWQRLASVHFSKLDCWPLASFTFYA